MTTIMLPTPEKIQIILPIVSILFLFITFKRSIYGVVSYFIIINAKLGDMYPVLGAIRFELIAAVIILSSIIMQAQGIKNVLPKSSILNKTLWVYFILGMASVPFSVDFSVSWNNGGYSLLKLMLFYVMVVSSIHNSNDLKKCIIAMIFITAWVAYEPFYNYFAGKVTEYGYGEVAYGRFGAARGHVALANTLSQCIPLAFYWAYSQRKQIVRIGYYLILALLVVGVVITKSRGGFLGLGAIAIGIIYLSEKRIKATIILLIAFVFILPFAGQDYLNRISTIKDGVFQSRSTSDRYLGLIHGISMMIKRPLLGVGIGAYAEARRRFFSYYFFSHNLYGEVLGELGLAGFSWFFWIYMIFKHSGYIKKKLDMNHHDSDTYLNILHAVQVCLFARLVIGNFSHCMMIWFWFFMSGLTVGIQNISTFKDSVDED